MRGWDENGIPKKLREFPLTFAPLNPSDNL